jgi:DNA helicase-2/ATP-dependent DNA helicase PcrA
MYVAITRAKKNLFIVLAKQRMLFGQTNCNQPSRFIREIDPGLLYLMGSRREVPKEEPQGETNREKSKKSIASAVRSQFSKEKEKTSGAREGQLGPDDLSEGLRVIHPRFGEGVILKVEPVGGDALITVDFDGMRKNMLANAAGLKKA